jgi:hypothetical protein
MTIQWRCKKFPKYSMPIDNFRGLFSPIFEMFPQPGNAIYATLGLSIFALTLLIFNSVQLHAFFQLILLSLGLYLCHTSVDGPHLFTCAWLTEVATSHATKIFAALVPVIPIDCGDLVGSFQKISDYMRSSRVAFELIPIRMRPAIMVAAPNR